MDTGFFPDAGDKQKADQPIDIKTGHDLAQFLAHEFQKRSGRHPGTPIIQWVSPMDSCVIVWDERLQITHVIVCTQRGYGRTAAEDANRIALALEQAGEAPCGAVGQVAQVMWMTPETICVGLTGDNDYLFDDVQRTCDE